MAAAREIVSESETGGLTFAPDGSLAAICRDGKVRVWDARSGSLARTIAWDAEDTAVTLPAGAGVMAAVGKDGRIKLWDLATGARRLSIAGPMPKVRQLVVSRDHKRTAGSSRAATGSDNIVRVWDESGKELFALPAGVGGTSALALSPDGGTLVAASYDADVRAWSSRHGELLRLVDEFPVSMFALAFSPDGSRLAAAGVDRTVYLFDAKSWKIERKLTGQPEMISALAFSPDGRLLLSGGFSDLTVHHPVEVLLWDISAEKVLRRLNSPQRVDALAFSPDGSLMAASNQQKKIPVWAVES
jgi:WD40 repeat protein